MELSQELWRGSWSGAAPQQKGSQEPKAAAASRRELGPKAPRKGEQSRSSEGDQVQPRVQQTPEKSVAPRKPSWQVRISKVRGRAQTNVKHQSGKGASLNAAPEIREGDPT